MKLNQNFTVLYILIILTIFISNVFGQSPKAKQIDNFITPFAKAGHFSGVVLASKDGKVIYEKAFGLANADFNIPNQPDIRIGVASITKSMTLVILVRLIEEKKIALNDKLSKYITDFPNGDKITIGMLAGHRTGIPHRVMPPEMETVSYTSAEMVEKIKQTKLEFEPGEKRLYSSAGYTVLARVLEITSGKSYSELLEKYVFTPAGMKDSIDFDGEMIIKNQAKDYFLSPGGLVNAELKDYSFLIGAGSVLSTARDTYRFGEAIVSGKYGEAVKSNLIDGNVFSSNGSTNGHRANVKVDGDKKYGFVVLSNLASGANDVIIDALDKILKDEEVPEAKVLDSKIVPNPNKNVAEFFGKYRREGATNGGIEIFQEDGQFYAGDIKLYPVRKDCFIEYKFYGEVCFVRDENRKIKHITWASPGVTSTWVRY